MMLAHIAGIPVEETALSFAPVAVAAGGVAGARLRRASNKTRGFRRRAKIGAGSPRHSVDEAAVDDLRHPRDQGEKGL
jgi:hypothetical protein